MKRTTNYDTFNEPKSTDKNQITWKIVDVSKNEIKNISGYWTVIAIDFDQVFLLGLQTYLDEIVVKSTRYEPTLRSRQCIQSTELCSTSIVPYENQTTS